MTEQINRKTVDKNREQEMDQVGIVELGKHRTGIDPNAVRKKNSLPFSKTIGLKLSLF